MFHLGDTGRLSAGSVRAPRARLHTRGGIPPHNFATQPLEGTREGFRAGEHGRGAGRVALGSGRLGAGLAKEPGGGRRRLPGQPGAGCRCFPINNRGRAV